MKIKVLLITMMMALINQCAMASRLPDDFWAYLQKVYPNSTQRFDSVLVLADGTTYIPLYPAQLTDEKNIKLEYTYPLNRMPQNKPEVMIFNNNFVLLKLMKDKNGKYTIGKYFAFKVYEPKEKVINALPYVDRIVHQWYVEEFISQI